MLFPTYKWTGSVINMNIVRHWVGWMLVNFLNIWKTMNSREK